MKMLTNEAFAKAKQYLFKAGRKLDQALYLFHFEEGNAEIVLSALEKFQNEDGGFGHGLEADLRTPVSSVIATALAFSVYRQIGALSDLPMVKRAANYLLEQFNEDKQVWGMIPIKATETPHPWWWSQDDLEKNFDSFILNPRARILGAFWDYANFIDNTKLEKLSQAVINRLNDMSEPIGMYDLQSCVLLLDTNNLPDHFRQAILEKLAENLAKSMISEISDIKPHIVTPLFLINSPNSLLAPSIPTELLQANLDWLIETQEEDGSWVLGWDWSEIDEELWAQAEKDWKGSHIVNNLLTLKEFDRW